MNNIQAPLNYYYYCRLCQYFELMIFVRLRRFDLFVDDDCRLFFLVHSDVKHDKLTIIKGTIIFMKLNYV